MFQSKVTNFASSMNDNAEIYMFSMSIVSVTVYE